MAGHVRARLDTPGHVLDVSGPVQRAEQPAQEVDRRGAGKENEPEPEEHEDLLVEKVDGQHTLDDVVVHARLVAYLELAECDAREPLRVAPVLAADQLLDDAQAVHRVVDPQERVQQEQLADGVDDVQQFDGHVAGDEVVAVQLAADEAAQLGDEVLDADHTPCAVLALGQQVAVHLVDDVANCLQPTRTKRTPSELGINIRMALR